MSWGWEVFIVATGPYAADQVGNGKQLVVHSYDVNNGAVRGAPWPWCAT